MTIDQFAQHLAAQPWSHAYINNLIDCQSSLDRPLGVNFIGNAFTWSETPEDSSFWYQLQTSTDYNCSEPGKRFSDLLVTLSTYFPNHPELFI